MFRAFLQQPLIDRRPELLFEDASEGGYSVAAQVGQFLRVVGFHVVRQYEAPERHLFPPSSGGRMLAALPVYSSG